MIEKPLTPEEVAELDTYGELHGSVPAPARAIELWSREIMYGKEVYSEEELKRQQWLHDLLGLNLDDN